MFRLRRQDGQASVELVAVLPFLALLVAFAVQLAIVGYGLWTSANAARAGARAEHVGGDGVGAARSAVPAQLHEGLKVRGRPLEVTLRVPSLIPGVDSIPVNARSDLGVEAHDG